MAPVPCRRLTIADDNVEFLLDRSIIGNRAGYGEMGPWRDVYERQ
jgi:hypothetical protein